MRSLLYLGTALFMSQFLAAQTLNDVSYLTRSGLYGSARYTSMAGAFGALGGDLSAINDNPAASSVFLNSEVGGSVNFQTRQNQGLFSGTTQTTEDENFYFDQFGAVFVFNNTNEESPWSRVSAAINVNRIANFDQNAFVSGTNTSGIQDYFLYYADGIAFEDIQLYDDETVSDIYRYLGDEVGYGAQQAFLGYQSYIIDPLSSDPSERSYVSNINSRQFRHELDFVNQGFHRKTSFNFSGLYQNKLHLGVNINRHRLEFSNEQRFFEGDHDLDSFVYDVNFDNSLISYGEGFSLQFGGILKLDKIRLGLGYDSPQWIDIRDETRQELSTYRFEEGFEIKETIAPEITNSYDPYRLRIPSKTSFSFAYIMNQSGLLSVEYSSQNLSNSRLSQNGGSSFLDAVSTEAKNTFEPVNTLKIGGEYRLKTLSLRAGYFYRTKNQERLTNNDQALTLGLGFDFGASSLNLSFVQFEQNQQLNFFSEGLTDAYTLRKDLTQITLSFNFKL